VGEDGQNRAHSEAAAHLRGAIAGFDWRLPNADRLCDSHVQKEQRAGVPKIPFADKAVVAPGG
jgi:hypothetical protein